MKKKILALLLTSVLCLSLAVPCFASSKPAVEAMFVEFTKNSANGISPTIWYRNNSNKTIKYIYWYVTAYNSVGDPEKSYTGNETVVLRSVGAISPFIPDLSLDTSYTYTEKVFPLTVHSKHTLPDAILSLLVVVGNLYIEINMEISMLTMAHLMFLIHQNTFISLIQR